MPLRRLDADPNLLAFDFHRKGPHAQVMVGMRAAAHFDAVSVADVKAPIVGGANHDIIFFQLTFGERKIRMGAGVLDRVKLIAHSKEGDAEAVQGKGLRVSRFKVGSPSRVDAPLDENRPFVFGNILHTEGPMALEDVLLRVGLWFFGIHRNIFEIIYLGIADARRSND